MKEKEIIHVGIWGINETLCGLRTNKGDVRVASKNSKINGDSPQQCDEKCYENCYIFRRGKCDPEKDECLGQELIDWYQETGR